MTVTCRVLKIPRQSYYRWLANPVTDAERHQAYLVNALFDAHRDDPEFGYRFLADEARAVGFYAADRTIWRICSDNGWWNSFGKRRSKKRSTPGAPAHDDLVRRDFSAAASNRLWLADITEHPTGEGKLLLRHQGLLLQPDRRLLHQQPDEDADCRRCPRLGRQSPR